MKSVQLCTIASVLKGFSGCQWVDMLLLPDNTFLS